MSVREYELVLMLDPEAPDEQRDRVAQEARQRIEGKGSLKAEKAWGMRKLAYEIEQRNEADYRFFRFESESPLLEDLDHNLKITDGVLRFRIFKVEPDSPVIEPPPPVALQGAAPSRGPRRGADASPPPPAAEPAPPAAAEPEPTAAPEPAPAAPEAAPAETEAAAAPDEAPSAPDEASADSAPEPE